MKMNFLLSQVALLILASPVTSVLAEDCNISFYCYGEKAASFSAIRVVVADEQGRATDAADLNPQQRQAAAAEALEARRAAAAAVPNTPATRPIAASPANNARCQASYDAQIAKATSLEALARNQMRSGQPIQAKRLLNNAAQLRSTATRMACH